MVMKTSGAAPCLVCGTEGGHARDNRHQPNRTRGLCENCRQRAYNDGTYYDYPLMTNQGPHPAPAPAIVDLDTLIPKDRPLWGAPYTDEWRKTVAAEQRRANGWRTLQPVNPREYAPTGD